MMHIQSTAARPSMFQAKKQKKAVQKPRHIQNSIHLSIIQRRYRLFTLCYTAIMGFLWFRKSRGGGIYWQIYSQSMISHPRPWKGLYLVSQERTVAPQLLWAKAQRNAISDQSGFQEMCTKLNEWSVYQHQTPPSYSTFYPYVTAQSVIG